MTGTGFLAIGVSHGETASGGEGQGMGGRQAATPEWVLLEWPLPAPRLLGALQGRYAISGDENWPKQHISLCLGTQWLYSTA